MGSEIFSLVNKPSKYRHQMFQKKFKSCKSKICADYNGASLWISLLLKATQVAMSGYVHTHIHAHK